jgi:hypothetical protein
VIRAAVIVLALSGCATTSPSSPTLSIDLALSSGHAACALGDGHECVDVILRNEGSASIEIPAASFGPRVLVHPLYQQCQGRTLSGEWETQVDEIGTYDSPRKFVRIAPGKSAVFQMGDCSGQLDRAQFDAYRWAIIDRRGNLHAMVAKSL